MNSKVPARDGAANGKVLIEDIANLRIARLTDAELQHLRSVSVSLVAALVYEQCRREKMKFPQPRQEKIESWTDALESFIDRSLPWLVSVKKWSFDFSQP